jgi:hypothetical protein
MKCELYSNLQRLLQILGTLSCTWSTVMDNDTRRTKDDHFPEGGDSYMRDLELLGNEHVMLRMWRRLIDASLEESRVIRNVEADWQTPLISLILHVGSNSPQKISKWMPDDRDVVASFEDLTVVEIMRDMHPNEVMVRLRLKKLAPAFLRQAIACKSQLSEHTFVLGRPVGKAGIPAIVRLTSKGPMTLVTWNTLSAGSLVIARKAE